MTPRNVRRVPAAEIEAIVKALYADADRIGWSHLPLQLRTAQYDNWVNDPAVGEVLTRYMTSENARSWIKDGPMKEYGRALQGAGRYARFSSVEGPAAIRILKHALGSEAEVVDGSIGDKPFHCIANNQGRPTYVAWGEAKNFRYLVWACLAYLAEYASAQAVIVITERMTAPTTADQKTKFGAIADRCSIDLKFFRLAGASHGQESGQAK